MRIIIAILIIFNINLASANNLYKETNKNQHEFNFENHEKSNIKIKFNDKEIIPNEKKFIINEEIKTDLIVYKDNLILFKKSLLEFLINKDNEIQIQSFSFNSDKDFLKLKVISDGIGYIDLNELKVKYNDQYLENNFEILGNHLIENKNIFFKDQIELKILKIFKQDSQVEIFYRNQKIDEICTIKKLNCNFRDLPKNTIIQKRENKWILQNENGTTISNEPQVKLIKEQNLVSIDILKNEPYKYTLGGILMDNKIQEYTKVNLDDEFETLEIEIIDNLSNIIKINISEKIKAMKKEYKQVKDYQTEIKELNSKLENIDKKTNNIINENNSTEEILKEKTAILDEKADEKLNCSQNLKITKVNPNTQEKLEYVVIKNHSQVLLNLEGCELVDSKENKIQLPLEINGNQEIKIFSKNILNNDKDKLQLRNKKDKTLIDSCNYIIKKENIYKDISCEEKVENQEIYTNNIETLESLESNLETEKLSHQTVVNSTTIKTEKQTNEIDLNLQLKENNILISEVNANPEGIDKGFEWIELVNKGEDFKGNIQIKINDKLEDNFISIKKDEYLILNPKNNLRNNDLKIELIKPYKENQILIITQSKEGESYSQINNEFQFTNLITKGKENPINKSTECEINKNNQNTNQITCGDSVFTLNQTTELKEGELVEIQYYQVEDKKLINEVIKKNDKSFSIKNASFTILSILSLVFMHRISF